MTSWIGGETVHHIVDSCIVKRNPVNSPWHYPRTPLYKHSHLFTKILWILFSWGFLVTGNSCGFQPGIILELAKALSTSQKIIPSIRIKYDEVPFGTILPRTAWAACMWATCLNRVAAHKQSHATSQLFVESRRSTLLFYLIGLDWLERLDNILRRKMLHILHILHIVHILQFLHLFHKYHILQIWHIQILCIFKYFAYSACSNVAM